jgi:hypothetical protein
MSEPTQEPTVQARKGALVAGAIFQIFVGVVAIVFGLSSGGFYPAFMRRPKPDERPAPKWLGRTVFVVVGLILILSGLSDLRHH